MRDEWTATIRIRETFVNFIQGIAKKFVLIAAGVFVLAPVSQASAQAGAHLILVKMVDKPNAQFAFEPAVIVAQRGDTLRFVQASNAPHNVHFDKAPKGAKLGDATTGPYLMGLGKTYDVIIDARFANGSYPFVCDPHQGVGMRGTLTVGASTKVATAAKP